MGYTGYQNNKTFSSKYKNKDLLASQEMANNVKLYIHIPEDDTTSLGWEYHFNEARSKAFLELIDIDQLVKLPDDKIKEISSSDYQWMGTFSFKDKDDYILRLHTYQDSKNTYFQFSDNGVYHDLNHGEIYYLNKLVDLSYDNLIKTLELYVDFNQYDYRHSITNKSDLLVPLTKEEIIDLLELRYVMNDFETLEHGIVYDNINKQQYLIVKSKRKDYQTIDATIKNNKLIVEFKASDAVYFKDYLHVFKINGSVKEYEFYMNGKEDIPTFG